MASKVGLGLVIYTQASDGDAEIASVRQAGACPTCKAIVLTSDLFEHVKVHDESDA